MKRYLLSLLFFLSVIIISSLNVTFAAAFQGITPQNTTTGVKPTFTWTPLAGQNEYWVIADDSSGLTWPYVVYNSISASSANCGSGVCSYTSTANFASGTAVWQIKAPQSSGSWPETTLLNFTVSTGGGTFQGLTPQNTTTGVKPTFTWTPLAGQSEYWVIADDSSVLTWPYVVYNSISASSANCGSGVCSYTSTTNFVSGTAVWQIKAPQSSGSWPETALLNFTVNTGGTQCNTSIDTDLDRLPDCYETNTNVFNNSQSTGTNPNNPDTDGDGIKDGDEVLGTIAGLNLPALGVNPLHKDVLIEYDWFDDNVGGCSFHSHRPNQTISNIISTAFNSAPVSNPDGSTGIHVIQDYGQGGVLNGGNLINDTDGVIAGTVYDSEYVAYKAANFASNRNGYFHYILMPHQYSTNSFSSGYAEINGDDVIVSTICGLVDWNQNTTVNTRATAFTIMHELGHNLGLLHGGDASLPNYKPNYNSVMNYRFQFPGVDSTTSCDALPDSIADYSRGNRLTLNESNLDETKGVCGNVAIDFNNNGLIELGIAADINSGDGFFDILTDHNDWGGINFLGINDATGAPVGGLKDATSCQEVPVNLRH
jgi:hypothetical protein